MRKRRANPSKNLIISRRTSDRIPEDAGRRVPVVYRPDRYSRVRSWLRERRAQRILRQLSGAKRTPRISTIAAEIDPITDSYRHTLVPRPRAPGRDYAVFVLSATSIRPVALGFNRFELDLNRRRLPDDPCRPVMPPALPSGARGPALQDQSRARRPVRLSWYEDRRSRIPTGRLSTEARADENRIFRKMYLFSLLSKIVVFQNELNLS